ncbi:hypothetical protein DIPPA_18182 [Diplonema papillatum]|nr:hypothetical protein DIPPA_18182 [Diplonema papillatum]
MSRVKRCSLRSPRAHRRTREARIEGGRKSPKSMPSEGPASGSAPGASGKKKTAQAKLVDGECTSSTAAQTHQPRLHTERDRTSVALQQIGGLIHATSS